MHHYPEVKESNACESWTMQAVQGVWVNEALEQGRVLASQH